MTIRLPNGGEFLVTYPAFIGLRAVPGHPPFPHPVWFGAGEKTLFVFTDDDLGTRSLATQQLDDFVLAPVPDEGTMRAVLADCLQRGFTHVGLDVLTAGGRPTGHVVPLDGDHLPGLPRGR